MAVGKGILPVLSFLLGAPPVQHELVRPVPGSRLVVDEEQDGELVVTYRSAGSRVRRTIEGRIYSLEYEVARDVSAEDVVAFFSEQAEGLDGGRILRTTENRLTFRFRRPDGGRTWCQVWATDGNYTLELADEPPGDADDDADEPVEPVEPPGEPDEPVEVVTNHEAGTVLARLVPDAEGRLPEGAGAALDEVLERLSREPSARLEIRAHGASGRGFAETVRDALTLFGMAADRLAGIEVMERESAETAVLLVLVPAP